MSIIDGVPVSTPATPAEIFGGDEIRMILDKGDDFQGTKALVEILAPYFVESLKALSNTGHTPPTHKFATATHTDYTQLPEIMARETREHLRELQMSAFQIEAAGDIKRAKEIRDVSKILASILKAIQQISPHEATNTGTPGGGHKGRSGHS